MPSPFPGMNPFIERAIVWSDFHQTFIAVCKRLLVPQVRPGYVVQIENSVSIQESGENDTLRTLRPDIYVAEDQLAPSAGTGIASLAPPAYATIPIEEPEANSFVEIRDREHRHLIAVIELLSPSNKRPGTDRERFLAKRELILNSPTHYIEIDLLREGPRPPLEDAPESDYRVTVSRADERPRVGVWPIPLRDALPSIPVPLRSSEPAANLNLQEALQIAYDEGAYSDYIYRGSPEPPLTQAERNWAIEILTQANIKASC